MQKTKIYAVLSVVIVVLLVYLAVQQPPAWEPGGGGTEEWIDQMEAYAWHTRVVTVLGVGALLAFFWLNLISPPAVKKS